MQVTIEKVIIIMLRLVSYSSILVFFPLKNVIITAGFKYIAEEIAWIGLVNFGKASLKS